MYTYKVVIKGRIAICKTRWHDLTEMQTCKLELAPHFPSLCLWQAALAILSQLHKPG